MRIASLRPSWVIPSKELARQVNPERRKNDLWGWVQSEATAQAFIQAVTIESKKWSGHEAFFIVAPSTTDDEGPVALYEKYWSQVPIKPEKDLERGFFDCSKAERLLEWIHP